MLMETIPSMPPPNDTSRLDRIEKQQDQQKVIIDDMRRSQDRMDVVFNTFIDEMKLLKQKDIDLSILVEQHDKEIIKQSGYFSQVFSIGRWVLALIVAIFLLYLGTILPHLHIF